MKVLEAWSACSRGALSVWLPGVSSLESTCIYTSPWRNQDPLQQCEGQQPPMLAISPAEVYPSVTLHATHPQGHCDSIPSFLWGLHPVTQQLSIKIGKGVMIHEHMGVGCPCPCMSLPMYVLAHECTCPCMYTEPKEGGRCLLSLLAQWQGHSMNWKLEFAARLVASKLRKSSFLCPLCWAHSEHIQFLQGC